MNEKLARLTIVATQMSRALEKVCMNRKVCELCEHVDADDCVPGYPSCIPKLHSKFRMEAIWKATKS